MPSEFMKWFVEQYGPRSAKDKRTDEELMGLFQQGMLAKDTLDRRRSWDASLTAALRAWVVKR